MTCLQPTSSPAGNRQRIACHLTNTRSPVPLLASLRCTRSGITDLAECCGADTPPASFSNVSRSRPTNVPARPFCYSKWLTLIVRAIGPSLAPAHFPTPLRAPGPAAASTLGLAQLLTRTPRFSPCAVSRRYLALFVALYHASGFSGAHFGDSGWAAVFDGRFGII